MTTGEDSDVAAVKVVKDKARKVIRGLRAELAQVTEQRGTAAASAEDAQLAVRLQAEADESKSALDDAMAEFDLQMVRT